jgi:1-acyl-sn-glycerol-3-phosphate acyltransferase
MLYRFCRAVLRLLFTVFYRLEASGQHNIPASGPVVLCGNHTSNLDPPLLGTPISRKVHYMAKAELFNMPIIGWLIPRLGAFPVKRGGVSKESIRLAIQLLTEGNVLGVFPEGTRSNAGGMGKKGAAMLALKSNAVVIPVSIIGNYSLFRKMRVHYGEPVDLTEFAGGGSDNLEAATDKIMRIIRETVTAREKMGKN